MDIEKIKNYNQKVLAIFGSLAILLICIIILWAATDFISELSNKSRSDETEIVATEKAKENFEKNIRTHQISFENLILVDTINVVYLIPVSQTALKLEEYIDRKNKTSSGIIGLLDGSGRYSDFYNEHNSFNNALIYESHDTTIHKLFSKRVSINKISLEKISGESYVIFAATDQDSNKDGIMDSRDAKTLYIYSVTNKKIEEIKSENTDFIQYELIRDNKQLIIKYGLDKDKNGTYTWDEPVIMKAYSIQDNEVSNLIAPELINDLQNTLDGKN